MIASTWQGGGTYGIRVGNKNAQRYFRKNWSSIEVIIDGKTNVFNLSNTFWTTCPEFRGKEIGVWLRKHGLDRWPKGKPHKVELIPLRANKFKLMK